MSKENNYWSDLYKRYYRKPKAEQPDERTVGLTYSEMRQRYYKKNEVIAEEPIIPDEEYQKELEMVKAYEVENAKLEETINELTQEEIEEFKRLNGITDAQNEPEHPTETTVKSVKVSKPKELKVKKEKPAKPTKQKETKPKAPRKTKK